MKHCARVLSCLSFFLVIGNVRSATVTWINASGGDWSNPENWSPAQVPGATDSAVIMEPGNYSVTLDTAATVAELDLGSSAAGTTQTFSIANQALTVNGPLQIGSSGQFNFNGGSLAGNFALTGTLTWSGGTISGAMMVNPGSEFNIAAGGGNGFFGLTLTNYGTVAWANTTIYARTSQNTVIYNYGLWDCQADNEFEGGYDGAQTIFQNYGSVTKTGSGGSTTFDGNVEFNNTGTVSQESGQFYVSAGTGSGGQWTTTNSASINFLNYDLSNQNTFAGSGCNINGNVSFDGSVAGILNWNGGGLYGAVTIRPGAVFNIVSGGGDGLNGLALTNYGTVNWGNTTIYGRGSLDSYVYNYGVWDCQADNTFEGGYDTGHTLFENFSTVIKTGSGGGTTFDGNVEFDNNGTVSQQSGQFYIDSGTGSSAQWATTNSASINFNNYDFAGTNTFVGVGCNLSGGVTFDGYTDGTLNWNGSYLQGALTMTTNSVLNIVSGGGDGLNGLILTNYGTVDWGNTTIYGRTGTNSYIYNYGSWVGLNDNTFEGGYDGASTYFENYGVFAKAGTTGGSSTDNRLMFENKAVVRAETGVLYLATGTNDNGSFTTDSGAGINFNGSPFAFVNTTTFNGTGTSISGGATFGTTNGASAFLSGTVNWVGGLLTGIETLNSNGVFYIQSGGGNGFSGLTFTNLGTVTWSNTTIYGRGFVPNTIYNYGSWNAENDNVFEGGYDGSTTLFENFGTFRKSATPGQSGFDANVAFNNMGLVDGEAGTIYFNRGLGNNGIFNAANGANINFSTYTFTNTNTFPGNGAYIDGGATFDGPIVGTLSWNGGSLSGGLTLAQNGTLNIISGGGNGLTALSFTNFGTVEWNNTTIYGRGGQNATIYNYGVWDCQADNTFEGGYDGGITVFNNFGTLQKSGTGGTTSFDNSVVFNNSGKVIGGNGSLQLNGSGISSPLGTFTTANGGSLSVNNMNFTNGASFGANTTIGGNTVVNGTFAVNNTQLVGGTLSGTNVLTGVLIWDGGSLSGDMTIATNGELDIVSGGGDGINGLLLTNYGTVNWSNTTLYGRGDPSIIYNYGVWDMQTDNGLVGGYDGGHTTIENFGAILKTGDTGTSDLDSRVTPPAFPSNWSFHRIIAPIARLTAQLFIQIPAP